MTWQTKSLADLCEVFADGDWIESKDQSSAGIRLIQTGNVGEGEFKDRSEKARYVSEATFTRLRCTEILEGDCLISRLPEPVGRCCILPKLGERMITAVDCTIIRFRRNEVLPQFFNYYARSDDYLDAVDKECTGTTRKRISRSNLGLIPVPVPSLAEQHRIVAILDEAFAGIAIAKANTEKSLQRASDLLSDGISERFAAIKELSRLGDACKLENGDRGRNYPGKQHRVSKGVPFINAGHLSDSGIDFSEMDYISEERFSMLGNGKIRPGDILFCLRGSLGKFASVGNLDRGAIASSLVIIRPEAPLDSEFLLAFLSSRQCLEQVERLKGGAAQPNLGAKDLKQFKMPLPELAVQRRVVGQIGQLQSEIGSLKALYIRKLAALDELKQSLLHQAFSGQL